MQRLLHGDVVQLGRFLLAAEPSQRVRLCRSAFNGAQIAETYRHKFGRYHVGLGDGSLAGWVGQFGPLPSEPTLDDVEYLACLQLVLSEAVHQASLTHSDVKSGMNTL